MPHPSDFQSQPMDFSKAVTFVSSFIKSWFAPQSPLLRLEDAATILDNDYLPVETGYGLGADGLAHVAATVYMNGVTAEMIDWWFGWVRTTEQYKLWHPRDHISSGWEGPSGEYIGGVHVVEEKIGDEVQKLKIHFINPSELFGANWKHKFEQGGYGTAVCARVAVWDEVRQRHVKMGWMFHLIKNEPDGVRMRSRFWLGDIEGVPVRVGRFVPESSQRGLMQHCIEEMTILGSILPNIYARENGS